MKIKLVFIFLICVSGLKAQLFPVSATMQMNGAIGPSMDAFNYGFSDRMNVILVLNDFTVSEAEVKLHFVINGPDFVLETNQTNNCDHFFLSPGVPLLLQEQELQSYLGASSWLYSGNMNPLKYTQELPEGNYEFCLEVLDVNAAVQPVISNNSCVATFYEKSDPPYLNFPVCGTEINSDMPLNILFQWTNTVSLQQSITSLEYTVELFEIVPSGIDENVIVQTTNPVFSTTTNDLFYQLLMDDVLLQPGYDYAWRVRARDPDNQVLFRNDGYSVPCRFTYGQSTAFSALFAIGLNAQGINATQARMNWTNIPVADRYELQIRKRDDNNWFSYQSVDPQLIIYNLEPNSSYVTRVRYLYANGNSDWSGEKSFNTFPVPDYSCNQQEIFQTPGNYDPLDLAVPGTVVQIGQFGLQLTEVQPLNLPGHFKGRGRVTMFSTIPVAVSFNDIFIDQSLTVQSGLVTAVSNGLENWINDQTTGTQSTGETTPENQLDYVVDTILVNDDGTITVTGTNGETTDFSRDDQYGNTFEDNSGTIYVVTADGNVIEAGQSGNMQLVPQDQNRIWSSVGSGIFYAAEEQLYGYDKFEHTEISTHYKTVEDDSSGKTIYTDWKSVQSEKYDQLRFSISQLGEGVVQDSLYFVTGRGVKYFPQTESDQYILTIVGGPNGDGVSLFAVINTSGGIRTIQKIEIVNYDFVEKELVILDPHSQLQQSAEEISTFLNQQYRQGMIHWSVTISHDDFIPQDWDNNADGTLELNSDLLSRYSDEMKIINNALKSQPVYSRKKLFLIIPSLPVSDENVAGEMPRGKNIGYIFTIGQNVNQTIAHELGHGAFGLQHSFSLDNPVAQGRSNNQMDYPSGTLLWKFQWDHLQNPAALTGLTDDEADQRFLVERASTLLIDVRTKPHNFLTPAGTKITVPEITHAKFNLGGAMIYFRLVNGKEYGATFNTETDYFYGYISTNSSSDVSGTITDEKLKFVRASRFTGYQILTDSIPVFTRARKNIDNTWVLCTCDYNWISQINIEHEEGASIKYLVPDFAAEDNCEGTQCIDPTSEGVKNGAGKSFYLDMRFTLPDDADPDQFVSLCNYITDAAEKNSWCIYGDGLEYISNSGSYNGDFIKYFKDHHLYSVEEFKDKFPFITHSRDYPVVFSTKDLWSDIPDDYNSRSIDHVLFNKGIRTDYEYTFSDLVVREKLKPVSWFPVITAQENAGRAGPLSQSGYFQQYVAEFGTNSAFPYIAGCAAQWSRDIILAYSGNVMAPVIGGVVMPYLTEVAGEYAVSAGIQLTSGELLLILSEAAYTQVARILLLYAGEKMLADAFIGATVDFLIQAAVNYYFILDNATWDEAVSNVDYYQVGASALENALSSPFNSTTQVLISMGINCITDGFTEEGHLTASFDTQDCAKSALVALLTNRISHFTFKTLKKIPLSRFKAKLKSLLNTTDEETDEIADWAGLKSGVGEIVRGVSKEEFIGSVSEFANDAELAEVCWTYFKNEDWSNLETIFNQRNINGGWPPNGGFIDVELTNLEVGFEFDRFGGGYVNGVFSDRGRYIAPLGASFESRALPANYGNGTVPYKGYRVKKMITTVKQGKSIPWFNQVGKGQQYFLPNSIDDLIEGQYIELIL